MDDTALPVLFFDGGLPDVYRDLIEGRAVAVGPDDADIARADAAIAPSASAMSASSGPTAVARPSIRSR